METLLYFLSGYAPLLIFCATALDIFFATGLLLYGLAMMSSVALLHATGMISTPAIVAAAYSGTILANVANFYVGVFFRNSPRIIRIAQHPKIVISQKFLKSRGLFVFMFVSRFITITRPLYAVVLGTLDVNFRRFLLNEVIIAFVWVTFWLYILLQGEALYFWITN